jgi:hypothetical protein
MAANKFRPHVFVIPEDDANRQMALGFEKDVRVRARSLQILSPAGGWLKTLEKLSADYYPILESNSNSHVLALIDSDGDDQRITSALGDIPVHLRDRVFILGTLSQPETLKRALNATLEDIGVGVADGCFKEESELWNHEQLTHNSAELARLKSSLFGVVFDAS